jgi:hypothetical protein
LDHSLNITGWDLIVRMSAIETESDWTTVIGETQIQNFIVLPTGYVVDKLGTSVQSDINYVDTNHADDIFASDDGGPVNTFDFVGDTPGSEAGTKTSVTIKFNTITFQIRQVGNCR